MKNTGKDAKREERFTIKSAVLKNDVKPELDALRLKELKGQVDTLSARMKARKITIPEAKAEMATIMMQIRMIRTELDIARFLEHTIPL